MSAPQASPSPERSAPPPSISPTAKRSRPSATRSSPPPRRPASPPPSAADRFTSSRAEFGDSAFLSVSHISGDSDFGNVSQTTGSDAQVTVGGQTGFVDGLHVSFNTGGVSGEFTLTSSGNVAGSAGNITVSGGGATFQLGTDANSRSTLGIESLASHKLGDANLGYLNTLKSGGANDLSSDPANAVAVARKAIEVVATSQGRIGAFQKYQVDTSINSLSATQAALKDAIGTINDVDFASETANLNRLNVLIQSGTSLLGLANQQAGQILSLLR
ncbi:MAG: flagellin [Phycisphaerae bacterium]